MTAKVSVKSNESRAGSLVKIRWGEEIDPRNHTNEHENFFVKIRAISWIVLDFGFLINTAQLRSVTFCFIGPQVTIAAFEGVFPDD